MRARDTINSDRPISDRSESVPFYKYDYREFFTGSLATALLFVAVAYSLFKAFAFLLWLIK